MGRTRPERVSGFLRQGWIDNSQSAFLRTQKMALDEADDEGVLEKEMPMDKSVKADRLENFSEKEAVLLRAVIDRLIPQEEEERVDMAGLLDRAIGMPPDPKDRGDDPRPEKALIIEGLRGIEETAGEVFSRQFEDLGGPQKDSVLMMVQDGSARGKAWERVSSKKFFVSLYSRALEGYCSHPLAWTRMGFPGPGWRVIAGNGIRDGKRR